MLNQLFNHSAVTAKIRGMRKGSLKNGDYEKLLSLESVQDIALYLKNNTKYAKALKDAEPSSMHRGRLENLLKSHLINEFMRLYKFDNGSEHDFLKLFITRYEIEQIKIILRLIDNKESAIFSVDLPAEIVSRSHVDINALARSKDIDEFLQRLKGTEYYGLFTPFINTEINKRLFEIEMNLDEFYIKRAWQQRDKMLKGKDREIVGRSLGTETDMLNILWIIRAKRYYEMDNEIIYAHLIPRRYKLRKHQIVKMVESQTDSQIFETLEGTPYKNVFKNETGFLEQDARKYIAKLQRKLLRQNPYTIAAPLAFFHLNELEVENIIRITEGKRYGIPNDRIRQNLTYL